MVLLQSSGEIDRGFQSNGTKNLNIPDERVGYRGIWSFSVLLVGSCSLTERQSQSPDRCIHRSRYLNPPPTQPRLIQTQVKDFQFDEMAPELGNETHEDKVDRMTVGEKIKNFPLYVKHQIVTLKPPGEKPTNPIKCLMMVNGRQWAFWFIGFLGWSWVCKS